LGEREIQIETDDGQPITALFHADEQVIQLLQTTRYGDVRDVVFPANKIPDVVRALEMLAAVEGRGL
jgi:hypothetical protein